MKSEIILAKIKKNEDAINKLKLDLTKVNLKNSKYIYVKEIDKEVEIKVHDKSKSFDDLKKIYGDKFESMLLTKAECEAILKNKEISKILKMDGNSTQDDFFIQQFNEKDKKRGYVADFYVNGGRSDFDSDGGSDYAGDFRGVRFVRKKISKYK